MEYSHLLLLILTQGLGQCIQVEDGCEVKSEWRIKYEWPDIYLSAWVAPDTQNIITIEVEFEGHFMPITYDNIVISNKDIQTERVREGRPHLTSNETDFNVISGWMDLIFTLNSDYSVTYGGKVITLGPVGLMPSILTIQGSNVTVNCQSDMRVWKSDKFPSSVPLDESLEHSLYFYSSKEFSPALSLEMRDIAFGWDDGALTTIPSKAQKLPPFQEHELTITCSKGEELICRLFTGMEKKLAEDMRVGDIPRAVTFQGRTDASFYLILHKSHSHKEVIASQALEGMQPAIESSIALLMGIVVLITAIMVVIVLVIGIRKYRQNHVQETGRGTCTKKDDIERARDTAPEKKGFLTSKSSSEDSGVDEISSQSSREGSEVGESLKKYFSKMFV